MYTLWCGVFLYIQFQIKGGEAEAQIKGPSLTSGVAKRGGEQVGAPRAQGRKTWGRINTLFQPFKNVYLKQKFRTKYAYKNAYFFKEALKTVKLGGSPPDLRVIAPVCCYSVVNVFLPLLKTMLIGKKQKAQQQIFCLCFLRAIFRFQTLKFCWWGRKNIFAPGRRVP